MKNKVIPRITRRIISICVILSIIVTGIEPWQIVKASDAVHVYTLDELRTAIANNNDIILEEDIKLSDYTFEYSEEHRRIGIYENERIIETYDVDEHKFFSDYESQEECDNILVLQNSFESYQGNFDGNSHVISGLFGNYTLFSRVTGNIKNLVIKDSFVLGTYKNKFYSYSEDSILAAAVKGDITGCKVEKSYLIVDDYGAGLVDYIDGTINDCDVDVLIFGKEALRIGGVALSSGYNEPRSPFFYDESSSVNIYNCIFRGRIEGECIQAAGIIDIAVSSNQINIEECYNYGNIIAKSTAAGIVNRISKGGNVSNINNYVNYCINVGNITVTGNSINSTRDYIGAGGIIGYETAQNGNLIVSNCVNKGSIKGIYGVGGIAGVVNEKGKKVFINTCSNTGTIQGVGPKSNTGGIVGALVSEYDIYSDEGTRIYLVNSCNSGKILADNKEYCGAIAGYIGEEDQNKINLKYCINSAGDQKNTTTELFGKHIIDCISECFEIKTENDSVNILKYESTYNTQTYKTELICTVYGNEYTTLCTRLNELVKENSIGIEDTVMSQWRIVKNELRQINIEWDLVDSILVPDETNNTIITACIKVSSREELKTAIDNNLDIELENDIMFSEYSFKYMEEYRRIGIYYSGELKAAYDVDDNVYYIDYESSRIRQYEFNVDNWIKNDEYRGHINGKGHVIYGMCPTVSENNNNMSGSFIGCLKGTVENVTFRNCFLNGYASKKKQSILCRKLDGEIENCAIEDSYLIVYHTNEVIDEYSEEGIGGSFSCSVNGTIRNCYSDTHIFANNSLCVGGIASGIRGVQVYNNNENNYTINDCTYNGIIEGKSKNVAGICAEQSVSRIGKNVQLNNCYFNGKIKGHFENAAGIVCDTVLNTSIRRCINNGSVEGCVQAAGIICSGNEIKYIDSQSEGYKTDVIECVNKGDVLAQKKCANIDEKRVAAGIISGIYDMELATRNTIKIRKCANEGSVNAENVAGGIVGTMHDSDNTNVIFNVVSCENNGDVSSVENNSCSGGIVGMVYGKKPNCYVYNNINRGKISATYGNEGTIAGRIYVDDDTNDIAIENCVDVSEFTDNILLFGETAKGQVKDCYDIDVLSDDLKIGRFCSIAADSNGSNISRIDDIDSYFELCSLLNQWVQEKVGNSDENDILKWKYDNNQLKYENWSYNDEVVLPTERPTASPTLKPTPSPTACPTLKPTASPTLKPTASPTASPTLKPTANPTASPTLKPTAGPTASPTLKPTAGPTASPTLNPTAIPTATVSPTSEPTAMPTISPIPEGMAGIIKLNEATVWDRLLNVITFGMYELPKPSVEIESKIVDSTVQYIIISDGSEIAKTEEELTEITVWKDYVGRIELEAEKNVVYAKITDNKTEYVYYICSDGITQFIPTATPTVEPAPTVTPSPMPTLEPTATPSPTLNPTAMPTLEPTVTPSPTLNPTAMPTLEPTASPSPTQKPTAMPTLEPTASPSPTLKPTATPNSTLKPTPSPSTHPTASPTPIVDPTVAPTVVPTEEPTSEPNLEPTQKPDSTIPPMPLQQTTQPMVLQGNNQNQSNTPAVAIKPTLKAYIVAGKKVILKWNKNTSFAGYNIYRSAKKKGKYMPLKNSVKTGTYTDTKVKANETWYYKIRGCIIINGKKQYGAWSESVKAAVGMRKPEITLKKEVTPSGEKYVRMRVKKCDGQYIQVYVRTKQKRYNLVRMPNSDWRKMKSTFNFRYSVGGKKMYFRIRSYGTYNNKLIYSPYSDSEGIKL